MAVKRYSNKELRNMTPEEREKLIDSCVEEYNRLGEQLKDVLENGSNNKKEIVKIVIKGGSGYGPADEAYEDKITIEANKISYEYRPTFESKINPSRKWSYKTDSPIFAQLFADLKKSMKSVIEREIEMFYTDVGGIEFIVTYDDKSKWKKLFWVSGDEFADTFAVIKKMVPGCEYVPAVLLTEEDYADDEE